MPDHEITPKEAARLLGVSPSTVTRYASNGLLHPRVLPSGYRRYDRAEVLALRDRAAPPGEAQN